MFFIHKIYIYFINQWKIILKFQNSLKNVWLFLQVRNSFIQSCHLYNININTLNKTDVCIVLVNEFYKKVQNAGKEVSLWTKSFSNDHLTLYEWQYKYLLEKFDRLLPEMDKNPNLLNTTNCEDDAPCLSKVQTIYSDYLIFRYWHLNLIYQVRENRSFVRSVLLFMNEYECQKSHWDEDVKDKLKSFESFTKSSHETAKHIDACLKEKFPEPY